ncbi:serine/threonine-protein phosphatase 2A activator-like isoform X1 [Stegodyphus dumicola]|uniref:serine/threonine-protein phosphatase 2A activator-like isoform X1 n=1 Tax=Stegodyphus dumicola TaxID=202533 RepID=UPI0015A7CAC2|nr:serine/threonine-protein phosphatase 2A activator-like isoform X1 [Stegodyphus dumicola]
MSSSYFLPIKEVSSLADMKKWEQSEAYHEYMGFILAMNEAVKGKKISDVAVTSEVVNKMCDMLEILDKWIDEIPPIEQPQRFGNKAFRTFYAKLKEESESLLKNVLPENMHPSIIELAVYLTESVGNSTRIDYGTGHEMSFAMLLCCLFKIGALKTEDSDQAILKIFNRYLILMRKLQVTYRMEPAGSHGVWSLDDYQFLPFIWGSSQLIGHPRLEPRSFPDEDIAASFSKDYMFMACIKFINQVKSGPFSEHSNQLWNISGVPTWEKVNSGLIKMYKKEVLGKHPVIQHVLFGSLLPIKRHDALPSVK